MPIYAYRCDACGLRKDVLQKMSDPALTVCPSCGAASFAKQLSAPAFQLKGTGWYVTDFRDNGKKAEGADAGKTVPAGEANGTPVNGKGEGDQGAAAKKPDAKDGASAGASGTGGSTPAAPAPKPADKSGSSTGSASPTGNGSSAA